MVGKLAEAAFADPDELAGIRVGCCRRCYGEGHGYQWREHEYLEAVREAEEAARSLPDIGGGFGFNQTLLPVHGCPECQGEGVERRIPRDTSKLSPGARMLYAGTKRTAQGVDVLLADQGKVRAQLLTLLGHDVKRVQLDGMLTDPVHLLGDLSEATPQEAARRYQEFIAKRS